jgi:hypothetical protein
MPDAPEPEPLRYVADLFELSAHPVSCPAAVRNADAVIA